METTQKVSKLFRTHSVHLTPPPHCFTDVADYPEELKSKVCFLKHLENYRNMCYQCK